MGFLGVILSFGGGCIELRVLAGAGLRVEGGEAV